MIHILDYDIILGFLSNAKQEIKQQIATHRNLSQVKISVHKLLFHWKSEIRIESALRALSLFSSCGK